MYTESEYMTMQQRAHDERPLNEILICRCCGRRFSGETGIEVGEHEKALDERYIVCEQCDEVITEL